MEGGSESTKTERRSSVDKFMNGEEPLAGGIAGRLRGGGGMALCAFPVPFWSRTRSMISRRTSAGRGGRDGFRVCREVRKVVRNADVLMSCERPAILSSASGCAAGAPGVVAVVSALRADDVCSFEVQLWSYKMTQRLRPNCDCEGE